jgi:hypothetical protein
MGKYGVDTYGDAGTPSAPVGLSECDLDSIGDVIMGSFNRTATVMRETRGNDDIGGQLVTWAEVGTVPCRIIRSDLRFVQQIDRVATVSDTRIVMPRNADVQMGDKLVIDMYEFRVEALPFMDLVSLTCSVSLWRP